MRIAIPLILVLVLTSPLLGGPPALPGSPDEWCATSHEKTEELLAVHRWRELQRPMTVNAVEPRVMVRDGMFFVEADEQMLAANTPLDLVGSTVRLLPSGDTYEVGLIPLAYVEAVGPEVVRFSETPDAYHEVSLGFIFPFFGESHDTIFVSRTNGIYFSPPPRRSVRQYDVAGAVAIDEPLISPLLLGAAPATFVPADVHVHQTASEAVVTWRSSGDDFSYDVQVRFDHEGAIDLSWREADEVSWGSVVVTPGYGAGGVERQSVVEVSDPIGDSAILGKPSLDLGGVRIDRIGDSDILDISISLAATIDQQTIAPTHFLQYIFFLHNSIHIAVHLTPTERWILLPEQGWVSNPASLKILDREIRFLLSDRDLPSGEIGMTLMSYSSEDRRYVDDVGIQLSHEWSASPFELNLSTLSTTTTLDRPLVQSFTLPALDPHAVWNAVGRHAGIDDRSIDALAIYQNFFTDIILYAGAYSTVGNPQVDGVSSRSGYGRQHPLKPALLHMNRTGYRYNTTDELSAHVLLHEFGHRWLYFFDIMENGTRTNALNPAGGHPAQFVHTPAAFDLFDRNNSSAMGGSWFTDNADGTFTASERRVALGFSWHELYLMGLASPEEVEPWFYIAGSDPALGDAYYPPDGIEVTGERRDVLVGQVVDAMGPRSPPANESRKRFTTYFVLLVRDLDAVTEGEVRELDRMRRILHDGLPVVTGGRASVRTLLEEPSRRRSVRRR